MIGYADLVRRLLHCVCNVSKKKGQGIETATDKP